MNAHDGVMLGAIAAGFLWDRMVVKRAVHDEFRRWLCAVCPSLVGILIVSFWRVTDRAYSLMRMFDAGVVFSLVYDEDFVEALQTIKSRISERLSKRRG